MGTISLPIPWADYHRANHPWAFAYGQPDPCPFCGKTRADQHADDVKRMVELAAPNPRPEVET